MKKTSLIILIIFLSGFLNKTKSCLCNLGTTLKEHVNSADVIISGQIISAELGQVMGTYKVLVLDKYKGNFKADTLTIITSVQLEACGYPFEIGKNYIIYGHYINDFGPSYQLPNETTFRTNVCTRTRLFDKKEIKKIKKILR